MVFTDSATVPSVPSLAVLPDPRPLPETAASGDIATPPVIARNRRTRLQALLEVVICSGYPTQLLIVGALTFLGVAPVDSAQQLSPRFVFAVSGIDTVVLLTLILVLMRLSGERARDLFIRRGTIGMDASVGLATVPGVFGLVIALQAIIHGFAPSLRNVPVNPFHSLMGSPAQLVAMIVLVVIAGGVREELQRAFLLDRFERHLGGARVGLVLTSLAFGLGHTLQGWDAAIVTAILGALWGAIYLWRRNVAATVVSHSLFNVGEVLIARFVTSPSL